MRIACVTLLFATHASGFTTDLRLQRAPILDDILKTEPFETLSLNLDIGGAKGQSHLFIRDIKLDFHQGDALEDHVAMPGSNGPEPTVSSGALQLDVIDGGHFVSMKGAESVKLAHSCWEINWKKDAPTGALICGFEVMEDYKRNEATLPKGRTYLSFPIWDKRALELARKKKAIIMGQAEAALKEKDEELSKMGETNNPIMKALHYRNAYAASARYLDLPKVRMSTVPDEGEVMELSNGLFLTTKGLIWTKVLPAGQQILLGTANISNEVSEE